MTRIIKTMEAIAFKALITTPLSHFPCKPSSPLRLLRRSLLFNFNPRFHSLSPPPLCSLSETGNGSNVPNEAGQAFTNASHSHHNILQVVLVSPQIPGNTGCIARTCAASAVGLHLVGPLGFQIDDTKLKRAGLDYWPYVVVKVHNSWAEFKQYLGQQQGQKRLLAFTKRGTNIHSDYCYRQGDYLVFGSETSGLPEEALKDCKGGDFGGGTVKIPMVETYVRCLNLSVSVGIALYEASRQLNYQHLQIPSESSFHNSEQSFMAEDIFA